MVVKQIVHAHGGTTCLSQRTAGHHILLRFALAAGTPDWLSKPAYLAFADLRAAPYGQLHRLAVALHEGHLPLDQEAVRQLVLQVGSCQHISSSAHRCDDKCLAACLNPDTPLHPYETGHNTAILACKLHFVWPQPSASTISQAPAFLFYVTPSLQAVYQVGDLVVSADGSRVVREWRACWGEDVLPALSRELQVLAGQLRDKAREHRAVMLLGEVRGCQVMRVMEKA